MQVVIGVMLWLTVLDEETAKLMNQLFVNIKVEKKRPDLDFIFQSSFQLQSNWWRLASNNVFR